MNKRHKEHTGAATPQHWRSRTNVHEKNVAALLIERGQQGMCVQGAEMYDDRARYGVSPRSRVSDLIHKCGWDIGSKPGERGCQCYWVRRDGDGRTYPTQRFDEPQNGPRPQLVAQPELPWSQPPRVVTDHQGRPLPPEDLPLFAEVRR